MTGANRRWIRPVVVALAIAAAVGFSQVAPFSTLGTANLALLNALVAVSLVVLTGWVGQISLAQASFVGIGSFSTAVVVRSAGLGFPVTILVGAIAAAATAVLLGTIALRVRGLYLAVATLIFAWMAQGYLFNLPQFVGTGGSSIAATEPLGKVDTIPYLDFSNRKTFYFILLATIGVALLAMANLRDSKTGRAFFAVKGSEVAAASLGINVTGTKLTAFAVSGFLAGLAGGLTMTHEGVASATQFTAERSLFFLAVAVVGGLTSLGGALASGALFASLEELFFRVQAFAGLLLVVSAVLLATVLLFFPGGLAGLPRQLRHLLRRAWSSPAAGRLREAAARKRPDAPTEDVEPAVVEADEGEEPVETPIVATGLSRVFVRLGELMGARFLRARSHGGGPTPDVLISAFDVAQAQEAEFEEHQAEERPSLAYVPGTATKIDLPPRPKRAPVLSARNVTVQFGGLTAVDSFDLEVREGEITALIGPNGAGKTTLFNAISGLNQPTSGVVELFESEITSLGVHQRAAQGMGRTFQVIQLFPELSVFDNLMVATHQRNPTRFFSHVAATRAAVGWEVASRERVCQVIELMGLEDIAGRPVAGLPFGIMRLVELARAFVTGAPFLMLDEPASGLDNAETDAFMDLLLWARHRLRVTMLLIEHDIRVVMSLADHIYVIDRGRRIAEGTPAEVRANEAVIAAYLGTAATHGDVPAKKKPARTKATKPVVAKR